MFIRHLSIGSWLVSLTLALAGCIGDAATDAGSDAFRGGDAGSDAVRVEEAGSDAIRVDDASSCPDPSSVRSGESCSVPNVWCDSSVESRWPAACHHAFEPTRCLCLDGRWSCEVYTIACIDDGGAD